MALSPAVQARRDQLRRCPQVLLRRWPGHSPLQPFNLNLDLADGEVSGIFGLSDISDRIVTRYKQRRFGYLRLAAKATYFHQPPMRIAAMRLLLAAVAAILALRLLAGGFAPKA